MSRLNDRAFEILRTEVEKYATAEGPVGKAYQKIVMQRLERMRLQEGPLASQTELRDAVKDMFSNFNEKALEAAAKANRPPGPWKGIFGVVAFLVGATGVVWVLNLPFPMIRWPVAKTAPFLLMPSFMSMDHNYRQAIAKVEQADQLVNNATASADFDLGSVKAKEAQKHLDALPVWFLGYYPKSYCTFFGCTWRFTFDEFEAARKNVGRMEATIFQQKNAQEQLTKVETALKIAKQQYAQAQIAAERQKASVAWQSAIDQLDQIPAETLAGKLAQKKLEVAKRDFQAVGGVATGSQQADNLIEAAKEFAMSAALASQKPPHPVLQWQKVVSLWEKAIQLLEKVPLDNPGYLDAQTKLAQYESNLGTAKIRLEAEETSTEALQKAKYLIAQWQKSAASEAPDRGYLMGQLREIINDLESVRPGTTAYAEAQKLLQFARNKQNDL